MLSALNWIKMEYLSSKRHHQTNQGKETNLIYHCKNMKDNKSINFWKKDDNSDNDNERGDEDHDSNYVEGDDEDSSNNGRIESN